jgi:hypothetical protein
MCQVAGASPVLIVDQNVVLAGGGAGFLAPGGFR